MASTGSQYFEITLDSMKDGTCAHFDVYANVEQGSGSHQEGDLVLYAKAPFGWTERELGELARSGIAALYIREEDRKRYLRYMKMNQPVPEVDYSKAAKYRITQIEEVGTHLVETAFLTELSDELLGRLKIVSDDLADCVSEDPRSLLQLKSLADHDLYTYIHSVGVATLATALALELGMSKAAELREYAFGGLLHDVGKKLVPLTVLNKAGPLTAQEWDLMKQHPENGLNLLVDFKVPQRTLDMISLHHEKLDGSGYPHGMSKTSIPMHVQIATVADIFNALTTTRCYHRKRTRFEALMFMKHHLRGKISAEVFGALVRCLATEDQIKTKSLGAA
jgi:putative nucleotidyltransferase with HDIG domain